MLSDLKCFRCCNWLHFDCVHHHGTGKLDEQTNELVLGGKDRISVVYYRAGYTPNDYGPDGVEWKARELMEWSTAIKCPSIGYHLIGSKHFQTIFAQKEVLLRYLSESEADRLRAVFVGLHSLQHHETDKAVQSVMADAKRNHRGYVLKPQREGGGNNYYNEQIPAMMDKLSAKELAGYILMERIYPKEVETVQVRNYESFRVKAICEIGIYSTFLHDGSHREPVIDRVSGTLLRTKQAEVTEGGVATGYAVLDSVVLAD